YRLPVAQPAACIPEDVRVSVIVDDYPEAIVLGYLGSALGVRRAVDAHVIVVYRVGTVRVEVDPDGIVALGLELEQQQLHVGCILPKKNSRGSATTSSYGLVHPHTPPPYQLWHRASAARGGENRQTVAEWGSLPQSLYK